MARHRVGVRVSAVLYLLFGICLTVYLLTTGETGASVAAVALSTISMGTVLFGRNAAGYVENYDNARHTGANSQ
jgi:hypothetical protein